MPNKIKRDWESTALILPFLRKPATWCRFRKKGTESRSSKFFFFILCLLNSNIYTFMSLVSLTSDHIIILPQSFFPLSYLFSPLLSPCFPLAFPLLLPCFPFDFLLLSPCLPLAFPWLSPCFPFDFPLLSLFFPLSFPFLSPFFPPFFPFLSPFFPLLFPLSSTFLLPFFPLPSLNIYLLPLLLLFEEVSISPPPSPLLQVQDDQIYSQNFYH